MNVIIPPDLMKSIHRLRDSPEWSDLLMGLKDMRADMVDSLIHQSLRESLSADRACVAFLDGLLDAFEAPRGVPEVEIDTEEGFTGIPQ